MLHLYFLHSFFFIYKYIKGSYIAVNSCLIKEQKWHPSCLVLLHSNQIPTPPVYNVHLSTSIFLLFTECYKMKLTSCSAFLSKEISFPPPSHKVPINTWQNFLVYIKVLHGLPNNILSNHLHHLSSSLAAILSMVMGTFRIIQFLLSYPFWLF